MADKRYYLIQFNLIQFKVFYCQPNERVSCIQHSNKQPINIA